MTRARRLVFGVLCTLTAINVASNREMPDGKARVASLLEVGDLLPELRLRDVRCQLLVAFSSSCPFCAAAAQRERELPGGAHSYPTTWVAATNDIDRESYRQKIHPGSDLLVSDDVYALLKVQAVPVSVAIDERGVVRSVGAYSGVVDDDPCIDAGEPGTRGQATQTSE